VWGTGAPRREFLHSDDMAHACVALMSLPDSDLQRLLDRYPPLVNIGCGVDVTIRELAETVARCVGFSGVLRFDVSKPDGTPQKLLDIGLLRSLGWRPTTSLEAGIASAYRDYLQRLSVAA